MNSTLLPDDVHRRFFVTPRGNLAALYSMPPAGVETQGHVVLVGGYIGAKEDFLLMLPLLAHAGYHAYAYDHLGQFESDGPDDDLDAYTVERLGEDLGFVLNEVGGGKPVHVLGHCSGGFIVRTVATQRPAALASVTLLSSGPSLQETRNPPPKPLFENLEEFRSDDGPEVLWEEMDRIWVRRMQRPVPAAYRGEPRPVRERLMMTRLAYLIGAAQSIAEYDRPLAELVATRIPILVVYGAKDYRFWPVRVYRSMAQQLGAELSVIANVGHWPNAQQPAVTCQTLVEFWSRLDNHDMNVEI